MLDNIHYLDDLHGFHFAQTFIQKEDHIIQI